MCGYGWQWGLVYDQLTDEFDEEFDAAQAHGEVSYLWRGHELGLWFTSEVSDGDSGEGAELIRFEPIDMSAVFYRRRMMSGGEARFWGGLTGDSDGILRRGFPDAVIVRLGIGGELQLHHSAGQRQRVG